MLLAESAEASALVVVENGVGKVAQAVAACRPDLPVVVVCPSLKVCRQLIVSRALYPIQSADGDDPVKLARDSGFAGAGPVVLIDADGKVSTVA